MLRLSETFREVFHNIWKNSLQATRALSHTIHLSLGCFSWAGGFNFKNPCADETAVNDCRQVFSEYCEILLTAPPTGDNYHFKVKLNRVGL